MGGIVDRRNGANAPFDLPDKDKASEANFYNDVAAARTVMAPCQEFRPHLPGTPRGGRGLGIFQSPFPPRPRRQPDQRRVPGCPLPAQGHSLAGQLRDFSIPEDSASGHNGVVNQSWTKPLSRQG